jgi:hypothetical protein
MTNTGVIIFERRAIDHFWRVFSPLFFLLTSIRLLCSIHGHSFLAYGTSGEEPLVIFA